MYIFDKLFWVVGFQFFICFKTGKFLALFMDHWSINLDMFREREEVTLCVHSVVFKPKSYRSSFLRLLR